MFCSPRGLKLVPRAVHTVETKKWFVFPFVGRFAKWALYARCKTYEQEALDPKLRTALFTSVMKLFCALRQQIALVTLFSVFGCIETKRLPCLKKRKKRTCWDKRSIVLGNPYLNRVKLTAVKRNMMKLSWSCSMLKPACNLLSFSCFTSTYPDARLGSFFVCASHSYSR